MTEDEPLRCQACAHNVPRDRYESYGDVCMRWCDRCHRWLDMYPDEWETAPCGKRFGKTGWAS